MRYDGLKRYENHKRPRDPDSGEGSASGNVGNR